MALTLMAVIGAQQCSVRCAPCAVPNSALCTVLKGALCQTVLCDAKELYSCQSASGLHALHSIIMCNPDICDAGRAQPLPAAGGDSRVLCVNAAGIAHDTL